MAGYKPSLRTKLTLWFLAIFAVVFTGVLIVAWYMHRGSSRRMLDDRLVSLAQGTAELLAGWDESLASQGLQPFQPIDRSFVILAVRDVDGNVLASRLRIGTEALPPVPKADRTQRELLTSMTPSQSRIIVGSPLNSRMITYRYDLKGRPTVRFVDIASMKDLKQQEREFLLDVFVVGALGSLLASAIAAWLVAGRAVAPMQQLGDAARQIDPEHVESRIALESADPEVERLQGELNNALSRLEEGFRAQERFISNVAHDLKTPISVMLAESQVLRPATATLEDFEAYRNSMIVEMQRVGGLIESFLTLARADQGEGLTRVTDAYINDIALEAIAECDPDAAQQEVRLVAQLAESAIPGEELIVRGDPDLLRTMIVNVIRNAIRFSRLGDTVEMTVRHDPGFAVIEIRDYGPGIPEEYIDSIFNRFVQAPSTHGRAVGTGLGLAIARSVVEIHSGTIKAANCQTEGCLFTIRLPLKGQQADEQEPCDSSCATADP